MTIYVDIIFLENIFMNYIILFATAIIVKSPLKIIRTLISSIIGSIYAVFLYMTRLKIYSNIVLKIVLSLTMIYIAFNPKNIKKFFKELIIFYLTSFTFGGVAFAFLYFISPQKILLEKGVLIGIYPLKIILLGGIVGFIIIITAFKNVKGKISKKDMICSVKLNINNKEIILKAIIDTGNFLKEPITKLPVMVVQKDALKGVLPDRILNNIEKIISGENINLEGYISKMKIIPFSSLGKENGLLLGVKVEKILLETKEEIKKIENVIVAIYDGVLNKSGKYQALVGLEIVEGGI